MSERPQIEPRSVRVLRVGVSANCSSVGSSVDLLFAAATVGSAALVAVLAALAAEPPAEPAPEPDADEAPP